MLGGGGGGRQRQTGRDNWFGLMFSNNVNGHPPSHTHTHTHTHTNTHTHTHTHTHFIQASWKWLLDSRLTRAQWTVLNYTAKKDKGICLLKMQSNNPFKWVFCPHLFMTVSSWQTILSTTLMYHSHPQYHPSCSIQSSGHTVKLFKSTASESVLFLIHLTIMIIMLNST